jgi:NADPH-dependent 2,4-dienoyl-CoA reductase/sulfur reductase-like enzyme/rhodanese-related sulfurtransferase
MAYNSCLHSLSAFEQPEVQNKIMGVKKVIILGGVAGGASAAARLRRLNENIQILVIERGPYVSFANCGLPYYVGQTIKERKSLLVQTEQLLETRFNLDIRTLHEAVAIDRSRKTVRIREVNGGREYEESYDKLVLSPGAAPIVPPGTGADLPGVFTLRTIPDADRIISCIEENKATQAVVVGGGFIGLEMVENLRHRGLEVSLVEMLPQVLPVLDPEQAARLHFHLREQGVKLLLGDGLASIEEAPEGLVVTTLKGKKIPAGVVVLAIGVKPESKLAAEAGLQLGIRGTVVVNEQMQTSDPDIYAVGDVAQVNNLVTGQPCYIPLAGPANKQGRLVADHICGRPVAYRGTQGTMILKAFDLTVAATGLNSAQAREAGIDFRSVVVHPNSHAGYYPGAAAMSLKLIFRYPEGRILGAQIVGGEGVDKRVDVLAAAIRGGMNVFDLEDLELAYAPPFGSAKDPVNMAGYVASNVLKHDVEMISWEALEMLNRDEYYLLDVRTASEYRDGHIPGSVHLPLDELRGRLAEVPADRRPIVVCKAGMRAYIACRILKQNGLDPVVLAGGWETYRFTVPQTAL